MVDKPESSDSNDDHAVAPEDIKSVLGDIEPSDLDPHDDDATLLHVLDPEYDDDHEDKCPLCGTDDDDDSVTEAVMSMQTRRKLAMHMRIIAPRLTRLRAMRRMRMASSQSLQYRSRKAALMILRKKVAGQAGAGYSKLSTSSKMGVDRQLMSRYGKNLKSLVTNISRKVLPMVRKKEIGRLMTAHKNQAGKMQTSSHKSAAIHFKKSGFHESEDLDLEEARRSASIDQSGDTADDAARGELIPQLLGAADVPDGRKVTFKDGSKLHIKPVHAQNFMRTYMKLKPNLKVKLSSLMHSQPTLFKKHFMKEEHTIEKQLLLKKNSPDILKAKILKLLAKAQRIYAKEDTGTGAKSSSEVVARSSKLEREALMKRHVTAVTALIKRHKQENEALHDRHSARSKQIGVIKPSKLKEMFFKSSSRIRIPQHHDGAFNASL